MDDEVMVDEVSSSDDDSGALESEEMVTTDGKLETINNAGDGDATVLAGTSGNNLLGNSNGSTGNNGSTEKVPAKLSVSKSGKNFKSVTLKFTLINSKTKEPISSKITLKFSNGKKVSLTTNSKGIVTYNVPFGKGQYKLTYSVNNPNIAAKSSSLKINIGKAKVKFNANALKTGYASGKTFNVKVIDTATKRAVNNFKISLNVYTGKKYKKISLKTGTDGIASYSASKLSIGTHKVVINSAESSKNAASDAKSSSIKISKASTSVKAPAVENYIQREGVFSVNVTHSESKKLISGLKLKIDVETNGKYNSYHVKTNSKGMASISTKSLSLGTHNVKISSEDSKFNVKSTSSINISKYTFGIRLLNDKVTVTANGAINFYVFDKNGNPVADKELRVSGSNFDSQIVRTSSDGKAGVSFTPMNVRDDAWITISFDGDDEFDDTVQTFGYKVVKIKTYIGESYKKYRYVGSMENHIFPEVYDEFGKTISTYVWAGGRSYYGSITYAASSIADKILVTYKGDDLHEPAYAAL